MKVTHLKKDCIQKEYTYKNQLIIEFEYWDNPISYWCIDNWKVEELFTFKHSDINAYDITIEIRSAAMPNGETHYGLYCNALDTSKQPYRYPGYHEHTRGKDYLTAKQGLLIELNSIIEFRYPQSHWKEISQWIKNNYTGQTTLF